MSGCGKPPPAWLVLAHESGNSGAPRMLLDLLREARARRGPEWRCEVALVRGGVLASDFAELAVLHRLHHPRADGAGIFARILRKLWDEPFGRARRWRCVLKAFAAHGGRVVLSNTGTNGALLGHVGRGYIRVVSLIHELGAELRRFSHPEDLRVTLARSDRFIAVSNAVREDLAGLGVDEKRITRIPNFLRTMPAPARSGGADTDFPVVLGCGRIDPVKGVDRFVEMALALREVLRGRVECVWVGGVSDARHAREIRVRAGDAVRFAGEVADAGKWLARADLVVVTSRSESFGRVALEGAALGRPVLAFAESRGPCDFLPTEALVTPATGLAMAERAREFLVTPACAADLGAKLRATVERHYLAEAWWEPLVKAIEGGLEP